MPRHKSFLDILRAHVNAEHIGYGASSILASRARKAFLMAKAEQAYHFSPQLAFWHGIDGLVNGFVRQAIRIIHTLHCTGDLLGREMLPQTVCDFDPQMIAGYESPGHTRT